MTDGVLETFLGEIFGAVLETVLTSRCPTKEKVARGSLACGARHSLRVAKFTRSFLSWYVRGTHSSACSHEYIYFFHGGQRKRAVRFTWCTQCLFLAHRVVTCLFACFHHSVRQILVFGVFGGTDCNYLQAVGCSGSSVRCSLRQDIDYIGLTQSGRLVIKLPKLFVEEVGYNVITIVP